MVGLIDAATGGSTEFYGTLRPFADLSLGFGINNIGDKIVYVDAAQADPLPRTAREGIAVAGGLRLQGWELGGATWSREGEDLLVVRQNNGTWEYQSGFGDLEFGKQRDRGESVRKRRITHRMAACAGGVLHLPAGYIQATVQQLRH